LTGYNYPGDPFGYPVKVGYEFIDLKKSLKANLDVINSAILSYIEAGKVPIGNKSNYISDSANLFLPIVSLLYTSTILKAFRPILTTIYASEVGLADFILGTLELGDSPIFNALNGLLTTSWTIPIINYGLYVKDIPFLNDILRKILQLMDTTIATRIVIANLLFALTIVGIAYVSSPALVGSLPIIRNIIAFISQIIKALSSKL